MSSFDCESKFLRYPFAIILTHKRGVGLGWVLIPEVAPCWILSADPTAENLSQLFYESLKQNSLQVKDVAALAVGIGPGSFTGLRLGCAFAQGFALGHGQCALLTLRTQPPASKTEVITDEDLQRAWQDICGGRFCRVDELVPCYGAEPGPVRALQEK